MTREGSALYTKQVAGPSIDGNLPEERFLRKGVPAFQAEERKVPFGIENRLGAARLWKDSPAPYVRRRSMRKKKERRKIWLRVQSFALAFVMCAVLVGPAVPAAAETEASGEGLLESLSGLTGEETMAGGRNLTDEEIAAETESTADGESATAESTAVESTTMESTTAESTAAGESATAESATAKSTAVAESAAAAESDQETETSAQEETEVQPEEYEVLIEEAVEGGEIQDPEQSLYSFTLYASVRRGTTTSAVNYRYGPGTGYASMGTIPSGKTLTILGDGRDSSGTVWFLITYNGKQGYVSSNYIQVSTLEVGQDADFEAYLEEQGFPESYKEKLRILHAQYPNWVFVAQDAGSWSEALEAETWFNSNGPSGSGSTQAVSLVDKNSIASWKSTETGAFNWATGEWVTGWDGDAWVVASDEIVAYYLDPRNFLDESSVFQFLDLGDTNTTTEAISQLASDRGASWLAGTYTHANGNIINYPQVILQAGQKAGYNPLALVASIIQELGVSGAERPTISGTVSGYENLYNYFNIGAFTDNSFDAAYKRGLWIAGGGSSGSTSWGRPWNTREKAIEGGAEYFAEYVNQGQNTLYLKRFDVLEGDYNHQYATNIQMADSEGRILSNAYSEDLRKGSLVFYIPVYSGMPSSACAMPMDDIDPTSPVREFVVRLYELVLGREPDSAGLEDWYNALSSGEMTAADAARGFILGEEYANKNSSDSQYVNMLYQTLLDRESDSSGVQTWLNLLDQGVSRKMVFAGFVNSVEFGNLCSRYGIQKGSYTSDSVLDQNVNVTAFVTRMYEVCLGRTAREDEREFWVARLLNHQSSGSDIAEGFFLSVEFKNKNLSNSDFLRVLYRTLFNREVDTSGLNTWLNCLSSGWSRERVLAGFTDSVEFSNLCNRYGITR